MKTKQGFSTLLTVLITAVVVGVLTGVISYSYAVSKKDLEIEGLKEQLSQVKEEGVDETADWKTYTNDKYGFSFKYPGEWDVEAKQENINTPTVGQNQMVIVLASPDNIRLAVYSPKNADSYYASWSLNEASRRIIATADNVNFIRKTGKGADTGQATETSYFYLAVTSDSTEKSADFSIQSREKLSDETIILFDQILSTFQFTK